jgi:hypothetical protein
MSKTVGVTISAISKGSASMSASWEEWSELRERNRGWSIVEFIVAFGPSFLGWFIDGISGVVVGLIFGALGLWVGPKAATTVREKVRMTTRSEGQ